MVELSDSNSLELRIAFHNAVSCFQDWTANVPEPRVKLRGKFCLIGEVCQEVANLSDPLPEAILCAPALMQADVGIAMAGGTDIAIESADIIILSNRLDAHEISRRSYGKMVQNVTLAFRHFRSQGADRKSDFAASLPAV